MIWQRGPNMTEQTSAATADLTLDIPKTKGPLDAAEIADAAITAALVVALLATGRLLGAGSVFQVVASFVVAVLAARRRNRAVVIASAAAACIALILGGLGPVSQAALAGVFGWCSGVGIRRGWGRLRSIGFTLLIAWPCMAASVMFFYPAIAINKKLRTLLFENIENQADGFGKIVRSIGSGFGAVGLEPIERLADNVANGFANIAQFLIDNWLLLIPATEFVYSLVYALVIRAVARGVLRRLDRTLVEPMTVELAPHHAPAPVPVHVRSTSLLRNGTPVTAPVELNVAIGEHVVIEGPNGSGKSTLLDALAGLTNHDAVSRPGAVGLGSTGGTARVGQRPEAQVVGTTVDEDLRWGLDTPDFDRVESLADVGLDLPGDRPTSELSGGELQRLALASALRRKPQLLLVDEVTSMLDPTEQTRINARIDALQTTSVIRTTHRNDAAATDTRFAMAGLHAPHTATVSDDQDPALRTIVSAVNETRLIRLSDVGYAHNATQPWAHEVLAGVDLSIHRYELLVVEGRNGSGKTTLARILAGLLEPTAGSVTAAEGLRRALAYQHVRLQLLRPTVREELSSLSGLPTDLSAVDQDSAKQRTRATNLEAATELFKIDRLLHRRIDELSGGEQRRVLLAGLVARGVALLVLDEPLAGLDASGRADLADTLDQVRLAGTSIVVVSHDVEWSPAHVDQRLVLDHGRLHRES